MQRYFQQLQRVWISPGNRGHRLFALCRAAWWTVRTRITQQPYPHRIFHTRKIWCHNDGFISRSIMLFGEWHDDSLKFIDALLRPGDHFLDIGANVGLYSLLVSEKLPADAIHCVEPGVKQRERLLENFRLNGLSGVHIHPFAVGNTNETMAFTQGDAVAHLVSAEVGNPEAAHESVTVRRLEDFVPDVVFQMTKIDVEGFELNAFRGAEKLLEEGRLPIIQFEINGSSERYGVSPATIFDYLRSFGYTLGVYHHDRRLISTDSPLWDDVLAFTEAGRELIHGRIPQVLIK